MLTVLTAGLPINAMNILSDAMKKVFDDNIEIQELTKDTLRSRVRLSYKNVQIVLVILDGVSSDICKDIENGLYKSDKYHAYSSDRELIEYLNNKYGISMSIEDYEDSSLGESLNVGTDIESNINEDYYKDKLAVKDDIIKNLETRIKDLQDFYCSESFQGNSDELEELKDKVIRLNSSILDLSSVNESLKSELDSVKESKSKLEEVKNRLSEKLGKYTSDYNSVVSELEELKVSYSKQSGVLRDKEAKVKDLEEKVGMLSTYRKDISFLKEKISSLEKSIASKDAKISEIRVDLESKSKECTRYLDELEKLRGLEDVNDKLVTANSTISSLQKELDNVSTDYSTMKKSVDEKDRLLNKLNMVNDELTEKVSSLENTISELQARVKDDDASLSQLNREKLELQSQLNVLSKSIKSDSDTDALIEEIKNLESKVRSLSTGVFARIGSSSMPKNPVGVKVLEGKGQFKNIRFVFAGSTDSRKGTYKCLLEEFRGKPESRYLIVDLVSETSIDYVFEIKNVVAGIEWFRKGGSVQQFISHTVLRNTQVLSPGLGYINDSYFLAIDWARRLNELENSGYQVVVFCGDISNLVGRVLHESFASYGVSDIYVVGNVVGSRSVITNIKGISNYKDSRIAYFDYNPAIDRFYNMVSRTNDCRIISSKKR